MPLLRGIARTAAMPGRPLPCRTVSRAGSRIGGRNKNNSSTRNNRSTPPSRHRHLLQTQLRN